MVKGPKEDSTKYINRRLMGFFCISSLAKWRRRMKAKENSRYSLPQIFIIMRIASKESLQLSNGSQWTTENQTQTSTLPGKSKSSAWLKQLNTWPSLAQNHLIIFSVSWAWGVEDPPMSGWGVEEDLNHWDIEMGGARAPQDSPATNRFLPEAEPATVTT